MIILLLVAHLTLAACLLIVFVTRVALLLKKKNSAYLRKLFYGFSASLVASGVLLSVDSKTVITAICLQSLALVAVVAILDFALVLVNKKIEQSN